MMFPLPRDTIFAPHSEQTLLPGGFGGFPMILLLLGFLREFLQKPNVPDVSDVFIGDLPKLFLGGDRAPPAFATEDDILQLGDEEQGMVAQSLEEQLAFRLLPLLALEGHEAVD